LDLIETDHVLTQLVFLPWGRADTKHIKMFVSRVAPVWFSCRLHSI